MAKKTAKRPVRTKQRPKRVPPRQASAATSVLEQPEAEDAATFVMPAAVSATSASATVRAGQTASRRSAPPQRRTGTITFNYAYLRHDIRTLGLLAPMMVVLVIVAYIALH